MIMLCCTGSGKDSGYSCQTSKTENGIVLTITASDPERTKQLQDTLACCRSTSGQCC